MYSRVTSACTIRRRGLGAPAPALVGDATEAGLVLEQYSDRPVAWESCYLPFQRFGDFFSSFFISNGFVQKPFDLDTLSEQIHAVLNQE